MPGPRQASPRSKSWCFTAPNYSDADYARLVDVIAVNPAVEYIVFGRETAPTTGLPHLQGYVVFVNRRTRASTSTFLGIGGIHLEPARATPIEAAEYCKKDGDYYEHGTLPPARGERTDISTMVQWIKDQPTRPSEADIACHFPSYYLRYRTNLLLLVDQLRPSVPNVQGDPRPWQLDLQQLLEDDPDDRTVNFLVDPVGAAGKTWMASWWKTMHPNTTQILMVGKRDDLAYTIDPTCKYFFFDVPRSQMEFLQYSVLEMLKNRIVFSPKYQSATKYLTSHVHVVVFCNEQPDYTKLSADRYNVTELSIPDAPIFNPV